MRLVVARFQHETNTFAATPTPPEAFVQAWGADAERIVTGADAPMSPMVEFARRIGATLATPVAAEADPSNRVADAMHEKVTAAIEQEVRAGCDGVLLELHGAMATERHDDGEAVLLARLRAAAPGVPIFISLDLHANISQAMIGHVDAVVGYKTYPHVDFRQTGEHVVRIAQQTLAGRARPVTRWCQLPLLAHTLAMGTDQGPMARAVEAARAAEAQPGVLAASVFGGFPLADVPDAGVCVVVTADRDAHLAQRTADRIAEGLWQDRDGLVYQSPPIAHSLAQAQKMADGPGRGPVLLFDHSDNVYSGGTGETLDVLQAALAAGLTGIATSPICDPEAVAQLWDTAAGAVVRVAVGNKVPIAVLGRKPAPILFEGRVTARHDGDIEMPRSVFGPCRQYLGRSVVLDTGRAQLIISERRNEPSDLRIFTELGIDPTQQRFLLIKSRMHCRPVFQPIARGLVLCDSDLGGPTSSKLDLFPLRRVRRPIHPLDPVTWGGPA